MGWLGRVASQPAVAGVMLGATGLSIAAGMMPAHAASAITVPPTTDTNTARSTAAATSPPVVFVGMNPTSSFEVASLRGKIGASNVEYIKSSKTQGVVTLGGVKYDLNEEAGIDAFVASLHLSPDRATALKKVFTDQGADGRDELAQLVRVFNQAERGQRRLERLVLSGHSTGSSVWGEGNGSLSYDTVGTLAHLFPKAAGQVEDLHLSACYTGYETRISEWQDRFPKIKTIWAYGGSAPGSWAAVHHLERWERATRGPVETLNRNIARGTYKAEYVATWSKATGYDNGQPARPLSELRSEYDASKTVVEKFRTGEEEVYNPQWGELRTHYQHIQALLGRPDVPAAERATLQNERDFVIRLLFYKNVGTMFQAFHNSTINSGFTELEMQVPDFSKLSRKEALEVIGKFDEKIAGRNDLSPVVKRLEKILHEGLRDLKPGQIPEAWI